MLTKYEFELANVIGTRIPLKGSKKTKLPDQCFYLAHCKLCEGLKLRFPPNHAKKKLVQMCATEQIFINFFNFENTPYLYKRVHTFSQAFFNYLVETLVLGLHLSELQGLKKALHSVFCTTLILLGLRFYLESCFYLKKTY